MRPALRVAWYLSAHGFGHATRSILVMEELAARQPTELHVRSMVSPAVLAHYLCLPHRLYNVAIDAAVIEADIFRIDIKKTAGACRDFLNRRQSLIESEAQWLREAHIDVVVFDVPPLAAAIAQRVGIPSVGISNFTWDYIYTDYLGTHRVFAQSVQQARADQAHATCFIQLPLGHPMEDRFTRVVPVPLVARRTECDRAAIRSELGLHDDAPALLVALRGAPTDLIIDGCKVQVLAFGDATGPGVRRIPAKWEQRFREVLVAADVVLSKPGYGICSECIANQKPLLHLPRHGFNEAEWLIRGMDGAVAHAMISPEQLADAAALHEQCAALTTRPSRPAADLSGARRAAALISGAA